MDVIELHKAIAFGEITETLKIGKSADPYYYFLNAVILRNTGRTKEAKDYINRNINEEDITSSSRLLALNTVKASIYINLGDLEIAKGLLKKCELYFEKDIQYSLYSNLWLSDYYLNRGMFYHLTGEYSLSRENYNYALNLNLIEELSEIYLAKIKNNLSILYSSQGKFQYAMILLHENLPIWEKLGFDLAIAQTLGNMAEIYKTQGNYNLSLSYFSRILDIFVKYGREIEILNSLRNIGSLYYLLGDVDNAKTSFSDGSVYLSKDITPFHKANFYFTHIESEILGGDLKAAKQILDDFERFNEVSDDNFVDLRFQLSNAIFSAHSENYKDKINSLFEFERILKLKTEDFETQYRLLIYTTELLFSQFKAFQDQKIIDDITKNINDLEKIAIEQGAHNILVQALILKSQSLVLQNYVDKAKSTLIEAISICEEFGLFNLWIQISDQFDHYFTDPSEDPLNSTNLNIIEGGVSSLDAHVKIESDNFLCLFLLNSELASKYEILQILDDVSDLKSSAVELILDKVSELSLLETKEPIYRYSYRGYKAMVLLDSSPQIGYLYSGSSFSAQKKLEAFSEAYRFYHHISEISDGTKSAAKSSVDLLKIKSLVKLLFYNQTEIETDESLTLLDSILSIRTDSLPTLDSYKALLHPVRIIIMKVMNSNIQLASSDLEKVVGGKSGTFETHLQRLIVEGYLSYSNIYIQHNPRKHVMITNRGVKAYQDFKNSLYNLV